MQDTDLPAGTDTTVARRSVFLTLRQISIIQHELFEFESLLICCTISLTSLSTSHPAPPWKAYQGAYSREGQAPVSWVKNLFKHKKARYRGLAKNAAQLLTLFGLAILMLTKGQLMAIHVQRVC